MAESFHNYERKLERTRAAIQRSDFLSNNKHAILNFADHCFSEGLSVPRVEKYLGHLKHIASLLQKDFTLVTKSDVEKLTRVIEQSDYSEWTKRDLRITLKKFYRWLRDTDRDPPEVAWLRSDAKNHKNKLPEELLTEEDVARLIDVCCSRRDKALVSILYETGCRIGEIAFLKIKHVVPHTHGFQLSVCGKTGGRRLLIISSVPYLTDWLNVHPRKSDPQAYLWTTIDYRNQRLSYPRINAMLREAATKAGVTKKVNPHTFRHSRATYLANHLTEAQMNEFFGWVQGSDMPSVYVHLSGRDVDDALLKTYGITREAKEAGETKLKPKTCLRCNVQNASTNKFCSHCGTVLDKEAEHELVKSNLRANRADKVLDRLINDREFVDILKRKLSEIAATYSQL